MSLDKRLRFFLIKSIGFYVNILSFINPRKAQKISFRYFSNPRKGKFKKNVLPSTLQETQRKEYHIDGESFCTYTWKGNNKIILLVHGWESTSARWKKTLPHLLSSGYTIVAIDAPAHGLSSGKIFTIPLFADFIDIVAKEIKPSILIGHSVGGTACMYYQYLNPSSNIEKTVILGAPSDLKVMTKQYSKMMGYNNRVHNLLEDYIKNNMNVNPEDFSCAKFAINIKSEGLILHDKFDEIVSIKEGEKIANAWENSTFIETVGLGHGLHDNNLYKTISDFLFNRK